MIAEGLKRDALEKTRADVHRAAYRVAWALTGETQGVYFEAVRARLEDALADAVLLSPLVDRAEFQEARQDDEAWDAAERLAELRGRAA